MNFLSHYEYIKTRRNGTHIYRSQDGSHFIKIGHHAPVSEEADMYEKLASSGIPLPKLLNVQSVMVEQGFSGKTFAEYFTESFEQKNLVDEELFQKFIDLNTAYFEGQVRLIDKKLTDKSYSWLDVLKKEEWIDLSVIQQLQDRIENTMGRFPLTWNHGDFNPYNIFLEGVIDLEDGFMGPLGYDTITAITQNFWFPSFGDYELHRQHAFSKDQLIRFLTQLSLNKLHINFMDKDIFGFLFVLRGIFVVVGSDRAPKSQKYRYELFATVLKKYLAGEDLLHYFLEHYGQNIGELHTELLKKSLR